MLGLVVGRLGINVKLRITSMGFKFCIKKQPRTIDLVSFLFSGII